MRMNDMSISEIAIVKVDIKSFKQRTRAVKCILTLTCVPDSVCAGGDG